MIDVPKNMVGVPGILTDKGEDDRLIKELMPLVLDDYPALVSTMLVIGTAWRWAQWNDSLHSLVWEAIPDQSVTSIIKDVKTGDITELWIEEQIEYKENNTQTSYATRTRHITKAMITESWKGRINKEVQYKNTFGFMPIPFGHNCIEGDYRGASVFARALRHMKAVHDIEYKRDEILSTFNPKIIQTVKDVSKWIFNNTKGNRDSSEHFDPFDHALFLNQEGENTQFIALTSDATSQHTAALADKERKIIKSSGIPELFFGALATGNHASTDADCRLAIEYIKSIRRELTKGTQELINQSLKILAYMRFSHPPQVSIQWGNLSLLSETQKAQVMGGYASAICQLLGSGAVTKEGAFYFTKELYPEYPAEDAKHMFDGMNEVVVEFSSKLGQPTFDSMDY